MKLDENYTIEKDPYCTILRYEEDTGKVNEKGKKIISKGISYHPNLLSALNNYVNSKCMDAIAQKSAEDIISEIKDLKSHITELINKNK